MVFGLTELDYLWDKPITIHLYLVINIYMHITERWWEGGPMNISINKLNHFPDTRYTAQHRTA